MIRHPIRTIGELLAGRTIEGLGLTASAREAACLMAERHVGAVAVMDGPTLAGIFTERDLMTRVVATGRDPDTTALAEVMTVRPRTIDASQTLVDGLTVMFAQRFRHLPVLNGEQVVGMLSCRDVPTEYLLMYENWVDAVGAERAAASATT
jgi:CBS domain-containing protein